ncbi:MAG: YCF48-related protein [Planctomycetota bacterium]
MARKPSHARALAALLVASSVAAQSHGTDYQTRPPADATLHDLTFVDALHGWAVGAAGVILHTEDGGKHWARQASGVRATLRVVRFADRQHGWAMGGVRSPYTGRSSAVVLSTEDGGRSWQESRPLMPGILAAEVFADGSAAALVEPNPGQPEPLYTAEKISRSWEAAPITSPPVAGEAYAVAALAGPRTGLLASRRVWTTQLIRGNQTPPAQAPPTQASASGVLRAACLHRPASAWLAGDGGLLLKSEDLGRSFTATDTSLPQQDFTAIAAAEDLLWLVGQRGDAVAHSHNRGAAWTEQSTGNPAPLRSLAVVDGPEGRPHAWAAGDWGRIVANSAARGWAPQRNADYRAVALFVAADFDELPLAAIAQLSLGEGYRVAVQLVGGTPEPAAVEAVGLLGAATLTSAQTDLQPALRAWQPSVVFVAGGLAQQLEPTGDQPPSAEPSGPARIFAVLEDGERGTHRTPTDRPLDATGLTAADAAAEARSLARPDYREAPGSYEYRLIQNRPDAAPPIGNHPIAGLTGLDEARRPPAADALRVTAVTRRVAQRRRNLHGLARAAQSDNHAAWLAQLTRFSAELPPRLDAPTLYTLAHQAREQAMPRRAADTLLLLAKRHPSHPLTEPALFELASYFGSAEAAHSHTPRGGAVVRIDPTPMASGVQQASAELPLDTQPQETQLPSTLDPSARGHLARCLKLADYTAQHRPALHLDPRMRLPAIAADRTLNGADGDAYLTRLFRAPETDPWRTVGRVEQWLQNPAKLSAPCPMTRSSSAEAKPYLDGRLDEPVWETATTLQLSGDPGGTLRVAHDRQYLYLALRCPHAEGPQPITPEGPRRRDADLAGADRVVIRLDTDRDYLTAFRFAVDAAGNTHDRCLHDDGWDPEWFVARHAAEGRWQIEAAIPWAELAPTLPTPSDAWVLHAERHTPADADADIELHRDPSLLLFAEPKTFFR